MLITAAWSGSDTNTRTISGTSRPGANTSTQGPLEKLDLPSPRSVEPTVMASAVDAGDLRHASPLLFPAATTVSTPSA